MELVGVGYGVGVREVVKNRRLVDHDSAIAYAKSKMLKNYNNARKMLSRPF